MASTAKQKFDAAVGVIQSLPKNGSFQPSQEMMLRFYAFYKQATLGPCSQPRPGFWELVKKAKWDAWNGLGNMSQEDAMTKYVEELKQIVEAMPQTDVVGDFLETLGTFYELVEDKAAVGDTDKECVKQDDDDNPKHLKLDNDKTPSDVPSQSEHSCSNLYETECKSTPVNGSAILQSVKDSRSESSDSGHQDIEEDQCLYEGSGSRHINKLESNGALLMKPDTQIVQLKTGSESGPKLSNGGRGEEGGRGEDAGSESDSGSEEFCDTTEPDELQVPALVSMSSAASSTPVKMSPKRDNVFQAITTPEEASKWNMSPIKDNASNSRLQAPIQSVSYQYTGQSECHDRDDRLSGQHTGHESHIPVHTHQHRWQADDGQHLAAIQMRGGGAIPNTNDGECGRPSRSGHSTNQQLVGQGHTNSLQTVEHWSVAGSSGGDGGGAGQDDPPDHHVSQQIARALTQLQQDMTNVLTRLQTLETISIVQRQVQEHEEAEAERRRHEQNTWWPFQHLNTSTLVALIAWPFIAQWIISFLSKQRSRHRKP